MNRPSEAPTIYDSVHVDSAVQSNLQESTITLKPIQSSRSNNGKKVDAFEEYLKDLANSLAKQ